MVDDREMWTRIKAGDSAAFDSFYRDNHPRLRAFLRTLLSNLDAAEDVAQETFAQLWNRPSGFDASRGTLRGYLYGIGRKRAAEWWRKRPPAEQVEAERAEAEEADRSSTESRSIVHDAWRRLPEQQRSLLWLREVEGRSYAELAEIHAIPVGTVRSRLFAAREALREIWHRTPTPTQGGNDEL